GARRPDRLTPAVFRRARVVERVERARRPGVTLVSDAVVAEEIQVAERLAWIERPVVLAAHVETRDEPVREPLPRSQHRRDADRRTIIVGVRFGGGPLFWRRGAEAALPRIHRERCAPYEI